MRGLTLLEVLISLALMTLMATATLPLVRSARTLSLRSLMSGQTLQAFQEQVEAFDAMALVESRTGQASTRDFDVVVLHGTCSAGETEKERVWLRFQSEAWIALRCVLLPPDDLEAPDPDPQR